MTWQGTPNVTTNDVAFTAAILDELEGQYCIDMNRIYATGKSQGGGLVGVLACDPVMSTRIAAFSPVSGAFYQTDFGTVCDPSTVHIACNPGRSDVPILDFHGLADNTIAYYGGSRRGACLPTIPHYCQVWADLDGLIGPNQTSRVPGALPNSTAIRYEWGLGRKQGLVTLIMDGTVSDLLNGPTAIESKFRPPAFDTERRGCTVTNRIQDVGHDWPSTQPNSDNLTPGRHPASFNASSLILDFFKEHPLNSC